MESWLQPAIDYGRSWIEFQVRASQQPGCVVAIAHRGRLVAEYAFYVTLDRAESFLYKTPEERYLKLIEQHPYIFETIPLYHISSYLGIEAPSLSRIRKRLTSAKGY